MSQDIESTYEPSEPEAPRPYTIEIFLTPNPNDSESTRRLRSVLRGRVFTLPGKTTLRPTDMISLTAEEMESVFFLYYEDLKKGGVVK